MNRLGISVAHSLGAQGAKFESLAEYPLSRIWSSYVARFLDKRIDFVVFTDEALPDKVRRINEWGCDLALEIHLNACGNCGASGSETLYFPGSNRGREAALIVQNRLAVALGNPDRGVKEGWYRMDRPGHEDYAGDVEGDEVADYFLRKTNCLSLIIEVEFIEKALAMTEDKIRGGAKAIAEAVEEILL